MTQVDVSFFKVLSVLESSSEVGSLSQAFSQNHLPGKIVTSVDEALQLLDSERFDLILIEFKKSSQQGFDVCSQIRGADSSFRNVPILAYVAPGENADDIAAAGCNDFIFKPATSPAFMTKLQQWADTIFEALPVLAESSIDKIRIFDDEEHTLVMSLHQIYTENTRSELDEIAKLVDAEDFALLRKKAHKLKSSAAQLGAFRFEKYCNLMEYDEALDKERAQKLYNEMSAEYSQSLQKFDQYCQKHAIM